MELPCNGEIIFYLGIIRYQIKTRTFVLLLLVKMFPEIHLPKENRVLVTLHNLITKPCCLRQHNYVIKHGKIKLVFN